MPFTPYHFGFNGSIGLVFRRWLDIPTLIAANIFIDIEVLIISYFHLGYPCHRYAHTFLGAIAVGIICGLVLCPFRPLFSRIMGLMELPYKSGVIKMILSGILGCWLHIIVDAIYHRDVSMFWPSRVKPLYGLLDKPAIEYICMGSFFLALVIYAVIAIKSIKDKKQVKNS